MDFADTPAGKQVHHVDYRVLVKDAVGTARGIHQAVGLPYGAEHENALLSFTKQNRQHKHGRNHYTAEQFGLSEEKLKETFSAYCNRFLPDLARS